MQGWASPTEHRGVADGRRKTHRVDRRPWARHTESEDVQPRRTRRASTGTIPAQLGAGQIPGHEPLLREPAPLPLLESFRDIHCLWLSRACSKWFVPEVEVANRLGLSTTRALSRWTKSLQGAEAVYGAHVSKYGDQEFWLLGPHQSPTAKSLGIPFTCDEQRKVVGLLESHPAAVRYGVFATVDATNEDIAMWWELTKTLIGSKVFYLDSVRDQVENPNLRVHERHLRFHFISRVREMINESIIHLPAHSATTSLATAESLPRMSSTTPSSTKDTEPSDNTASASRTSSTSPPTPNFDFHDHSSHTAGQAPYSAVTRILYIVMRESGVSNAQAPHLITSILMLLGFTLKSAAPTKHFAGEMVKEGGIHALAQMGLQIREWGEAGERLTVCIDAASIGEEKYEGLALVKCTENGLACPNTSSGKVLGGAVKLKTNRKTGATFTRLGIGLTELSAGTDECKFVALQENMQDIVNCHNAVLADDYGKDMSMYDMAKPMSATVNDHAETVVSKKFAPFIDDLKRAENGTLEQVLTAALCMQRHMTDISKLPKAAGENVPIKQAKLTYFRPSIQKKMNAHTVVCTLPVTGVGVVPTTLVQYILQLTWSPDVLQPRRYVAEFAFFCHLHKLCLTMDHGAATLKTTEKEGAVAAQLVVEEAAHPNPGYQLSDAATTTVHSVAKLAAKPKTVDEKLSKGSLFKAIRQVEGAMNLHFERILGSRGASAVFSNALPTLLALLDSGEWGITELIVKLEATAHHSNRLNTGVKNSTHSDVAIAELRVMAVLHIALLRPLQTYIQNHSTQGSMVKLMHEYKDVLTQLHAVRKLTVSTNFAELPWLASDSSSMISITADDAVNHTHTAPRRTQAISDIIRPTGLSTDRQELQLKLMVPILTKMAGGMLTALDRLMSPKYGSMFSLPANDPMLDHLAKIPATSDSIERYFGRASWLRNSASGQNMTKTNVNHTLNIMETKVGSRLVEAYLKEPEVVTKMMTRAMNHKAEYEQELKIRRNRTLAEKIEAYKAADKERKRKLVAKAANVRMMVDEAGKWTHLPLLSSRRSGQEPSITGKAAEIYAARDGTEKQNNKAVSDWAVRWLTIFETVFDLDEVAELKHVFYGASGRASIQAGRSQTDLLQNLADCSHYMAGRVDHFAAHLQRVRKPGQTAMEGEAAEAGEGTDDARQKAPGPAANSTAGAATVPEPAPGPRGS